MGKKQEPAQHLSSAIFSLVPGDLCLLRTSPAQWTYGLSDPEVKPAGLVAPRSHPTHIVPKDTSLIITAGHVTSQYELPVTDHFPIVFPESACVTGSHKANLKLIMQRRARPILILGMPVGLE